MKGHFELLELALEELMTPPRDRTQLQNAISQVVPLIERVRCHASFRLTI